MAAPYSSLIAPERGLLPRDETHGIRGARRLAFGCDATRYPFVCGLCDPRPKGRSDRLAGSDAPKSNRPRLGWMIDSTTPWWAHTAGTRVAISDPRFRCLP